MRQAAGPTALRYVTVKAAVECLDWQKSNRPVVQYPVAKRQPY